MIHGLDHMLQAEENTANLVDAVREHLATLTDEGRIEFIAACMEGYCQICGTPDLPCFCASCYDE